MTLFPSEHQNTWLSKELDEKVLEFLEEQRSNGLAVSNIVLLRKGSEIAGGLRLQGFKCTSSWLQRWKGRYNVGYRRGTNVSQKVPADYADQILQVRKDVISLRKKNSIEPSHIYNMDQFMCRFDMSGNRTNSVRGGRTIRIKTIPVQSRKWFTVALAASASGEKLPAFIIFKERNGILGARVLKKLHDHPKQCFGNCMCIIIIMFLHSLYSYHACNSELLYLYTML